MTLNRRIGLGFTLGVDPAGGTAFQILGAIVDGWDESEAKADVADTSILVDQIKQKAKSQIDPGEITLEIAWDPDDATSTTLAGMLTSTSATPPNWQISYPGGSTGAGTITGETFKAFVTGLGRAVKKGALLTAKVTLTKTSNLGMTGSGA